MSNVVAFNPSQHQRTHRAAARPTVERAVYTVREIASLLSLSLGSTYALVRQGEIPAKQLGNRWVIPKKRFHAWLEETNNDDPQNGAN